MCVQVCARLVGGCPCIELIDDHSGACRYRWQANKHANELGGEDFQELIKQLLLATTEQELGASGRFGGPVEGRGQR